MIYEKNSINKGNSLNFLTKIHLSQFRVALINVVMLFVCYLFQRFIISGRQGCYHVNQRLESRWE